jgi:imidazolonepropionase-like amidohydrolase
VDSGIQSAKGHGSLPFAVAELTRCGFTVAEAVATATSQAADACGLGSTTGRLEPGLAADLLVVDGDLEADVDALHRVAQVFRAGQPLT